MGPFLTDAVSTNDLNGACARAGVHLVEIQRHRSRDPLFDLEMATVEQSLRLAAYSAVQARAAGGDLKAIKALTDGTLNLLAEEPDYEILPLDHPRLVALVLEIRAEEWERDARSVHDQVCPHCGRYLVFHTRLDAGGVVTLEMLRHFPRPDSLQAGGPEAGEPQIRAENQTVPCPQCGTPATQPGHCKQCGCLVQFDRTEGQP